MQYSILLHKAPPELRFKLKNLESLFQKNKKTKKLLNQIFSNERIMRKLTNKLLQKFTVNLQKIFLKV